MAKPSLSGERLPAEGFGSGVRAAAPYMEAAGEGARAVAVSADTEGKGVRGAKTLPAQEQSRSGIAKTSVFLNKNNLCSLMRILYHKPYARARLCARRARAENSLKNVSRAVLNLRKRLKNLLTPVFSISIIHIAIMIRVFFERKIFTGVIL